MERLRGKTSQKLCKRWRGGAQAPQNLCHTVLMLWERSLSCNATISTLPCPNLEIFWSDASNRRGECWAGPQTHYTYLWINSRVASKAVTGKLCLISSWKEGLSEEPIPTKQNIVRVKKQENLRAGFHDAGACTSEELGCILQFLSFAAPNQRFPSKIVGWEEWVPLHAPRIPSFLADKAVVGDETRCSLLICHNKHMIWVWSH